MSARNMRAAARRRANRLRGRRAASRRRARRGVLLLVVLSLLVLFSLLGTAFLATSSSYRTSAKVREKAHRTSLQPGDVMERALRQLLRDTNNPHSSIRYHSLLRDMYGTDGFAGRVYAPNIGNHFGDATAAGTASNLALPRYSAADGSFVNGGRGPTDGQLIDFYIDSETLQLTQDIEALPTQSNDSGPFELELAGNGVQATHFLSPTDGYYNGALLTLTSGPASGQTCRIVDYDYVGDQTAFLLSDGSASPMFRVRVVSFGRADGSALTVDNGARFLELSDLVRQDSSGRYYGHSFIVSGRPFNGTGVGYNALADISAPRLTASEEVVVGGVVEDYWPVALTPNARYPIANGVHNPATSDLDPMTDDFIAYGQFPGPGGSDESYDAPDFQNMFLAWQSLTPRPRGRVVVGGVSGEVAARYPSSPISNVPAPDRLDLEDVTIPSFHRPALINYWLNRLFNATWLVDAQPDPLLRGRAVLQPFGADLQPGGSGANADPAGTVVGAQIIAIKRKILMRPLPEDHPAFDGSNPTASAAATLDLSATAITDLVSGGTITFPFWEATGPWDVDNDNDGVPDSIWVDLGMPIQKTEDGRLYKPLFAMLVQDMDGRLNLNAHGSADHFTSLNELDQSNQSGASILANLVMSETNLNAAIADTTDGSFLRSSSQLPRGSGYGAADVSLRSVLGVPPGGASGRPLSDSYVRLFRGRAVAAVNLLADAIEKPVPYGRYGSFQRGGVVYGGGLSPSATFDSTAYSPATIDPLAQIEFVGYPSFDPLAASRADAGQNFTAGEQAIGIALGGNEPSGFGEMPDLNGSYGVGVGFGGRPLRESANDYLRRDATGRDRLLRDGAQGQQQFFPKTLSVDTPYEANLMDGSRRGEPVDPYNALGVNDDALFTVAELERLLRSYDADAGRLPDRLWELVDDFDPNKLAISVAVQSGSIADYFSSNDYQPASAELVAAQLQADQNRRSVTTRSFDVPATVEHWTDRLRFGADGVDDDGGGDDYFSVMGSAVPDQARLLDYLRYRVTLELQEEGVISVQPDAPTNDQTILAAQTAAQQIISEIISGRNDLAVTRVRVDSNGNARLASYGGLIAPEVIAGLKMDLNRPFGDGRDNNGNGVVDEPIEAGEPHCDFDGDGTISAGEFLDLDGNGQFNEDPDNDGNEQEHWLSSRDVTGDGVIDIADAEPIVDSLWRSQLGTSVPFDHTNGQDANGRGAFVAGERIHDDGQMARQLYARHLYCLMLLLTDENYLAPIDPSDTQARHYVDPQSTGSVAQRLAAAGLSNVDARRVAFRKLTCRKIAQWAINCADARDPDVIQTPFEYDENPWDGWNVVDRTSGQVYPLDGDITTDENLGVFRDLSSGTFTNLQDLADASAVDQTRGVVWGAERPELLITEGLAIHDRRQEDLAFDLNEDNEEDAKMTGPPPEPPLMPDGDLDQRLLPNGFAFIELYNPNSEDSQRPAELYRDFQGFQRRVDLDKNGTVAADETVDGVLLDKLTNGVVNGQRSPVWRMICVEEHPNLRNDDETDDAAGGAGATSIRNWDNTPRAYQQINSFLDLANGRTPVIPQLIDPDFPTFDAAYRPLGFIGQPAGDVGLRLDIANRPAYIEREVYFAAGRRRPQHEFILRNFDNTISGNPPPPTPGGEPASLVNDFRLEPGQAANTLLVQSLPPEDIADPNGDGNPADRLPLAPILPGHYGVVGSAGFDYWSPDFDGRYLSTIGRQETARSPGDTGDGGVGPGGNGVVLGGVDPAGSVANSQTDPDHIPGETRRIELVPHPNPYLQQVLVAANGGPEFDVLGLNTAGAAGSRSINVTDPTRMGDGQTLREFNDDSAQPSFSSIDPTDTSNDGDLERYNIKPAVAIPVANFSLSQRIDNYLGRYDALNGDPSLRRMDRVFANGEGAFVNPSGENPGKPNPFTTPFDTEPELTLNHTTPAYRTVHLQRLANPLLVWNPPPTDTANHNPDLPVNPYLTVDSLAVDLTSINGTTADADLSGTPPPGEPDAPGPPVLGQNPNPPVGGALSRTLTLASTQRGDRVSNATQTIAPRSLWRHERRSTTNDLRPSFLLDNDRIYPGTVLGVARVYGDRLAAAARPQKHFVDFAIRHSLGYANVQFDRVGNAFERQEELYTSDFDNNAESGVDGGTPYELDINGDGRPGDLIGVPKIDGANPSTYPWLAWGNRPFISAHELLQVPAASAGTMLRDFTTYVADAGQKFNPYDGDVLVDASGNRVTDPVNADANDTNTQRFRRQQAPFGHLLNFFQSATRVAASPPNSSGDLVAAGAPSFHRLMDYVHVPSRFVATDQLANPVVFNEDAVANAADPRVGLLAPFNKLPEYREPGRVNLNTVTGNRESALVMSSPVYDGIMHRLADGNVYDAGDLVRLGHRGPAWRDVVVSRRGYVDPDIISSVGVYDTSPMTLNPAVPTLFGNPFRASDEGDYVPVPEMRRLGAESSLLRSHVWSPGANGVWGDLGDNNADLVFDDADEAGRGGRSTDDVLLFNTETVDPVRVDGQPVAPGAVIPVTGAQIEVGTNAPTDLPHRVPLFSSGTRDPAVDADRNSALRYGPLTRLSNLVTTRSGVYAVWITVGFFEVSPAPDWNYATNNPTDSNRATVQANIRASFLDNRDLYDRVYPDGYQLGAELGSETGGTKRFKSFYMIDRTLPVGFRPGDDTNVDRAILLQRRIE